MDTTMARHWGRLSAPSLQVGPTVRRAAGGCVCPSECRCPTAAAHLASLHFPFLSIAKVNQVLHLPIRDEELEATISSSGFSLVELNNLEASVLPEVMLEPAPAPGRLAAGDSAAAPARELSMTENAPPPDESWVLVDVGPPVATPVPQKEEEKEEKKERPVGGQQQEAATAATATAATATAATAATAPLPGFSSLPPGATRSDRQRLAASGTSCAPLEEWMLQRMTDDDKPPHVAVRHGLDCSFFSVASLACNL